MLTGSCDLEAQETFPHHFCVWFGAHWRRGWWFLLGRFQARRRCQQSWQLKIDTLKTPYTCKYKALTSWSIIGTWLDKIPNSPLMPSSVCVGSLSSSSSTSSDWLHVKATTLACDSHKPLSFIFTWHCLPCAPPSPLPQVVISVCPLVLHVLMELHPSTSSSSCTPL